MRGYASQAHNMKLKQTKEPVTSIAGAIAAPEPLRSLTWCSAYGRRNCKGVELAIVVIDFPFPKSQRVHRPTAISVGRFAAVSLKFRPVFWEICVVAALSGLFSREPRF